VMVAVLAIGYLVALILVIVEMGKAPSVEE